MDRIHQARLMVTPRSEISLLPKALALLLNELREHKNKIKELGIRMDKKIRKIEKDTKKVGKELKGLEKADKKRDKIVAVGKKAMKKKGKC